VSRFELPHDDRLAAWRRSGGRASKVSVGGDCRACRSLVLGRDKILGESYAFGPATTTPVGAIFSSWGVAVFLVSPNYFLQVKTLSWLPGIGDSGTFAVVPFLEVSSRRHLVSLLQGVWC
jgi:hypothetical protein